LQRGNSIRGETVTYLIDEGRFIAQPRNNQQVESIYILSNPDAVTQSPAPSTPSLRRKPAARTSSNPSTSAPRQ
jgi:lipopolysaccharide export system protein LptA